MTNANTIKEFVPDLLLRVYFGVLVLVPYLLTYQTTKQLLSGIRYKKEEKLIGSQPNSTKEAAHHCLRSLLRCRFMFFGFGHNNKKIRLNIIPISFLEIIRYRSVRLESNFNWWKSILTPPGVFETHQDFKFRGKR